MFTPLNALEFKAAEVPPPPPRLYPAPFLCRVKLQAAAAALMPCSLRIIPELLEQSQQVSRDEVMTFRAGKYSSSVNSRQAQKLLCRPFYLQDSCFSAVLNLWIASNLMPALSSAPLAKQVQPLALTKVFWWRGEESLHTVSVGFSCKTSPSCPAAIRPVVRGSRTEGHQMLCSTPHLPQFVIGPFVLIFKPPTCLSLPATWLMKPPWKKNVFTLMRKA